MRIGLVIDYFKPHAIGGAEISVQQMARALVERGHEVAVLTPNYGAPAQENDEGVSICRHWFPRQIKPGRTAPFWLIANPIYYLAAARAIARTARHLHLDVLHAQNSYVQVPTYLAARWAGLPCVVTIRDIGSLCAIGHMFSSDPGHICSGAFLRCVRAFLRSHFPDATLGFRFRFALDWLFKHADLLWRRRVLKRFSRIVFISQGLRDEYVRQRVFAREDPLSVIYHLPPQIGDSTAMAPPPAEWQLPATGLIVTFAGKVSLGKGAHILLEAIPRVLERHRTAVFVFAGRPTPQIRTSPTNVAPQNIRWLGHLPWDQVQALLARSSLVVMPSVCFEGLGRVVIEANNVGVPVVASRRGGIPELVVEGKTGWLVEPGNAVALAERIITALADRERLRRMGELARMILTERFDPDKITSDMVAVYQGAISGHSLTR